MVRIPILGKIVLTLKWSPCVYPGSFISFTGLVFATAHPKNECTLVAFCIRLWTCTDKWAIIDGDNSLSPTRRQTIVYTNASYTHLYPKLKGVRRYTGFTLSVRPSVRLWTASCPLCIFNNTHRIHFIFTHLTKQLKQVCCVYSVFQNSTIWSFGKFLNLWLWLSLVLIQYEKVWIIMGRQGYPENTGSLVVLVGCPPSLLYSRTPL